MSLAFTLMRALILPVTLPSRGTLQTCVGHHRAGWITRPFLVADTKPWSLNNSKVMLIKRTKRWTQEGKSRKVPFKRGLTLVSNPIQVSLDRRQRCTLAGNCWTICLSFRVTVFDRTSKLCRGFLVSPSCHHTIEVNRVCQNVTMSSNISNMLTVAPQSRLPLLSQKSALVHGHHPKLAWFTGQIQRKNRQSNPCSKAGDWSKPIYLHLKVDLCLPLAWGATTNSSALICKKDYIKRS